MALSACVLLSGCNASPKAAAPVPAVSPAVPGSASPSLGVKAEPTYVPRLPTSMTDEGGNCVPEGRCGYYVAGSSCKGVEWCHKADLVEPGVWSTEGGSEPNDCMWGLSKPPAFGVDGGGYATGYTEVTVPRGAIFDTRNCLAGWTWLRAG